MATKKTKTTKKPTGKKKMKPGFKIDRLKMGTGGSTPGGPGRD